ncbi:MAG: SCO family protein [Burkholderiaceae bacterium]
MTPWTPSRRGALLALAGTALLPVAARAAGTAPSDSVYQLPAALTDQDGRGFELPSLRGSPVLFSMFYTSCEMVCPMIFETVQATLAALPAAEQKAVKVLMLSFDPARDTVAVLRQTFQAHGCDSRWTLARGDEATVRKVAAALGFQYRRLSSGEFNHSTQIDLLDKAGRVVAKTGQLGKPDPALVKAARQAVQAAQAAT